MKSITLTGIISLFLLIFAVSPASALIVPVNSTNLDHTLIVSNLPLGASVQFVLNGGIPVPVVAVDGTARYLPLVSGTLEIIAMSNGSVLSGYSVKTVETGGVTPTPADRSSSSSSGSTGGGGGGVITSEPYDNIARSETYEKNLVYNTSVLYMFKLPEHGIYEIAVTGKESENNIALRVEALKGPTKIAGISAPPGTVYKNINVWAGSKRIKEVQIRFKVENTWIENNNIASGELMLVRWDGSQWAKLVTSELKKDDTYTFYEANTEGFSSFAITALKGGVPAITVTDTGVVKPTETAIAPVSVPTKKGIPGFEGIMVIAAISLLVASLNNGRKRR